MQLASQLPEHRSLIKACCAAGYRSIRVMGHQRRALRTEDHPPKNSCESHVVNVKLLSRVLVPVQMLTAGG